MEDIFVVTIHVESILGLLALGVRMQGHFIDNWFFGYEPIAREVACEHQVFI